MMWFRHFLSAVLLIFAALQWNDPDPIGWMLIYLFPIIGLQRPVLEKRKFYLWTSMIYVMLAVWFFPAQYQGVGDAMQAQVPQIEEARESLGLLIAAMILASSTWFWQRSPSVPSV